MKIKYDNAREKRLLDDGIGLIENFGNHFVAYNTKFLGYSYDGEYVIRGKSTKDSIALREFCFGYDGQYNELQLLHVYQMKCGKKYAATEISMCVYAYWDILE